MNYKSDRYSLQLPITRDPAVASSLSVIPGLGQIYNSEPRKGLLFLLVGLTNVFLIGLLSWSRQLVESLSTLSNELNIRPNADIVGAISNFHPGSASMNALLILFAAFIAYSMRDAYDKAKVVRRNSIYAPVVMHMDEASSGSYLFHAALMVTLTLFAFFFLLPTPIRPQVTVIEIVSPNVESPVKPRTKTNNRAVVNSESRRDPNLKKVVQNPSPNSNTGAKTQHQQSIAKPQPENKPAAANKPAEAPKQSSPAKAEPVKQSKPAEVKPAPSAPALQAAKPNIQPVAAQSASTQTPSPLKPPVLRPVAAPLMPQLQAPATQPKSTIDPAKMLAGLMPISAPSAPSLIPNPAGVAVKSNHGAPRLVASNLSPSALGVPQPGISSPVRSIGSATPTIVETGSRSNKSDHGTGGPAPTGASRSNHADDMAMITPVGGGFNPEGDGKLRKNTGPSKNSKTGPSGDDNGALDKKAGEKASTPGHDEAGGKNGERGTTNTGKLGEPTPEAIREVDFSNYMAGLQRRIKRAWYPPKCGTSKKITVRFNIARDGTLRNLKMVGPSGTALNDQAAIKAVLNAAPFAPLPQGSPEEVDIEFKFDYNVFNNSGSTTMRSF
ncbi:MAG: TonB family protein [Candidatus Melainabacteria bacterium]|mgnify:CR=1 FL=1|nr:TonB family protein [Candidatus Melainabacteria bacterium]